MNEIIKSGIIFPREVIKAIITGERTHFVHFLNFAQMVGRELYLVSKGLVWGVIVLKNPEQINWDGFVKTYKLHGVSEEEFLNKWGIRNIIYLYPFEVKKVFDNPLKFSQEVKEGRAFIPEVNPEGEVEKDDIAKIQDIHNYNPHVKSESDWKRLKDDLRIVVGWFASLLDKDKSIKFSEAEIAQTALKIFKEIARVKKEKGWKYRIKPEDGTAAYQKLWGIVSERLSPEEVAILEEDTGVKKIAQTEPGIKFLGTRGYVEESSATHKYHTGIYFTYNNQSLLLDLGREQNESNRKIMADFYLLSHVHPDHVGSLGFRTVVMSNDSIQRLDKNLGIDPKPFDYYKEFDLGAFKILPIPVLHSIRAPMTAFRIKLGDFTIFSATDVLSITKKDREKYLKNIDLWIADGSSLLEDKVHESEEGSYGHKSLKNQLAWVKESGCKIVLVTHHGEESIKMGDDELKAQLKKLGDEFGLTLVLATDGMVYKWGGAKSVKKAISSGAELLFRHNDVHLSFRKAMRPAFGSVVEDENELILKHIDLVKRFSQEGYKHEGEDELDEFTKIVLAPAQHSGEKKGERITLEEIKPFLEWDKFGVRHILAIVGSLATIGETENDIDVVFQGSKEEMESRLGRIIIWRFLRAFPAKYWKRFSFHPADEFSGPFTSYIPIADLTVSRVNKDNQVFHLGSEPTSKPTEKPVSGKTDVTKAMVRAKNKNAEEMAARAKKADKITLGEFFLPLKPVRGYFPSQRGTVETFLSLFKDEDFPVFNSAKRDGFRGLTHKNGDKVTVWSEDGTNITESVPRIVEAVRKFNAERLILDHEIESYIDGVHQPREDVAGRIHSKEVKDDTLVANVFDVLWFEGDLPSDLVAKIKGEEVKAEEIPRKVKVNLGDIHNLPFSLRWEILKHLNFPQREEEHPDVKKVFNLIPHIPCENRAQLKRETIRMSKLYASEGAVAKIHNFKYNLAGIRSGMMKYHNSFAVNVMVTGVSETRIKGIRNYYYSLKDGRKYKADKVGEDGLVHLGKTFSTVARLKKGDTFLLEGETLNLEKWPNGKYSLSIWVPRFIKKTDTKVFNLDEAVKEAKSNRCLQEKIITLDGNILYKAAQNPYMELPPEGKKCRYVVHHHWRGRTVHTDIRIADVIPGYLIGWTVDDLIEGVVKKPVLTLEEAKYWDAKPEISKINWKTGRFKFRKTAAGNIVQTELRSQEKSPEPEDWLDIEGVAPIGKPGSTKNYPGVFHIMDRGYLYFGTQKPFFHEYFPFGGKLKGRLVFRQLTHWVRKGVGKVLPPANIPEAPERSDILWVCFQPLDQMPYVLSERAIEKKWIPPLGHSALPKWVKDLVPNKLEYWKAKDLNSARRMRDDLVSWLKEHNKYKMLSSLYPGMKKDIENMLKVYEIKDSDEFLDKINTSLVNMI